MNARQTSPSSLKQACRMVFSLVFFLTFSIAFSVPAHASGWSATGSLSFARSNHTATLLPNGKVLVAGGPDASAELYDSLTGQWSAAASMTDIRAGHTATLLPNGKVLVAGGDYAHSSMNNSAEIYDPIGNTWSSASNMNTARGWHTSTLLPNGKVLVAGGSNEGIEIASAELFDPANNTWSSAGNMHLVRMLHTATLLANGKVLVAGGISGSGNISASDVEIFDPVNGGNWTVVSSMVGARNSHTATLLPDGRLLVAGGNDSNAFVASTELYNSTTNAWTSTLSLNGAREYHTATLLPNGTVLVSGGFSNDTDVLANAEIYNPSTAGQGVRVSAGNMTTARASHTATLLPGGRVLVVGGTDGISALASAELYDPANGSWANTGSMSTARESHTATLLPDGKVLVAGGNGIDSINGAAIASAESYAPSVSGWTNTGSMNFARAHHTATLLSSGKVLVTGGDHLAASLSSAELYDPASKIWSNIPGMKATRTYHTATLLPNGKVLVVGGAGATPTAAGDLPTVELYNPVSNSWSSAGNMSIGRESHTATLLPNGKVMVEGGFNSYSGYLSSVELYDPATNLWSIPAVIEAGNGLVARSRHTATLLPNGSVLISGGSSPINLNSSELDTFDASNSRVKTGNMTSNRDRHTATLLADGRVLVAGGSTNMIIAGYVFPSAELYDRATRTWSGVSDLLANRYSHSATLLANGKVLVAGGHGVNSTLASAELYDSGLSYSTSRRPSFEPVSDLIAARSGQTLNLAGTGFIGDSEASSGNSSSSASNLPVVQLRRLDNGAEVPMVPASMSATHYTSQALGRLAAGYYRLTMFVNGIPSDSRLVRAYVKPPNIVPLLLLLLD